MTFRCQAVVHSGRLGAGFTLIELVAVILLVGIISSTIASRSFSVDDAALQSSRDDIVAAARFAQQQAMDTDGAVVLALSTSAVSVSRDGLALQFGSVSYPLALPAKVSLSPSVSLAFNRLGETSAQTITLSAGSETTTVSISEAGYAN